MNTFTNATNNIANKFNKLKNQVYKVNNILNTNFNGEFMNINFDDQELIEEQMDILFYEYETIKKLIQQTRIMKLNSLIKDNSN